MVAFQNDTQAIESKIGPIPNHDALEAAIVSGKFKNITPSGFWLVAWFAGDEIEAMEFAPIDYCRERWEFATNGIEGPLTLEILSGGMCYVCIHPPSDDDS